VGFPGELIGTLDLDDFLLWEIRLRLFDKLVERHNNTTLQRKFQIPITKYQTLPLYPGEEAECP
jgi:hypothetical protein